MPPMAKLDGSCSCGAIKLSIPDDGPVGTCHCSDCRKATGGTHGISYEVKRSRMLMTGTPKVYEVKGVSGNIVRRHFCGTCGSPIYVEADMDKNQDGKVEKVFVKIGLFPPKTTSRPTHHIFVKDMEDWETPLEGVRVMETQ